MILGLKGNSGCQLQVLGDKIQKSCLPSYNSRLEIQCKKQSEFNSDLFTTPKIYESGINDNGNFFFNMEFKQCKTFDKVFNIATKDYLDSISDRLIRFVIGIYYSMEMK